MAYSQTFELEKIVVGSKRGLSEEAFTGDVDSIDDFSSAGNEKVLDELRQLPGVSVSQSGAPGQQSTIFIRGSEARHVLVLIDGVRVNDPSNTDKFFNPSLLNVGDIEKVEVLKGSQSLLYGSEAIGGVVNIVTKKGNAENYIAAHAGFSQGLMLDNTHVKGNSVAHLHLYHEKSEGISAARSGDEKDGFENKGATFNFSTLFNNGLEGEWTYKVMDQFLETDTIDFATSKPVDAEDDYSKSIQQIFSQKLNLEREKSEFTYLLGANKVDRFNKSFGNVVGFNAFELTNELHWKRDTRDGSFLLGLENLSETFSQSDVEEKFAGLTSLLFIVDQNRGSWFWQYGLRTGAHTQFGSFITPSLGLARKFGEQRLSMNYQQGFKSPTLYQLYGPDFGAFAVGNTELDPETNEYVDLNYRFKELVDVSLFFNHVEDIIEYDQSAGYRNASFMETYGLEASSKLVFGKNSLNPGVFLAHYHVPGDREALRRPSQKATLGYERAFENMSFILDWVWNGRSFDLVGDEQVELAPYDVFDLHFEYRDKSAVYSLGVENLFGESYEQVYGYNSQPFTLSLKAKYFY